jgi:hypothetical protein
VNLKVPLCHVSISGSIFSKRHLFLGFFATQILCGSTLAHHSYVGPHIWDMKILHKSTSRIFRCLHSELMVPPPGSISGIWNFWKSPLLEILYFWQFEYHNSSIVVFLVYSYAKAFRSDFLLFILYKDFSYLHQLWNLPFHSLYTGISFHITGLLVIGPRSLVHT